MQAKLLQSFENYDSAHAPLRGDALSEGGVCLQIDLRRFDISVAPDAKATIELSAKLIDGTGHLKVARIFEQSSPIDAPTVAEAATAFRRVFEALARDVVTRTASVQ